MLTQYLEEITVLLESINAKKIFLITGEVSYSTSGAKRRLDPLLKSYSTIIYPIHFLYPSILDVTKGVEQLRAFEPDVVVAIGGGNVIDFGKLLKVFPSNIFSAIQLLDNDLDLLQRYFLIAIPTTAGTGSEVTEFAVLYHDYQKYSISASFLKPDFFILDPSLTLSLPDYITAVTGFDAFSQAIESYWAIGSTNESKEFALNSLKLILSVYPSVIYNPTYESRMKMLIGAHLSGKAINISKTTAAHAVSYILTQLYKIPHGHAVALTLPFFFEYNLKTSRNDLNLLDIERITEIKEKLLEIIGCNTVEEGKEKIKRIINEANLETRLSYLGASDKNDIIKIVKGINVKRMANNPRAISEIDLESMIESIW